MGEHFRPPYNGKFYIMDRDGRQVEVKADFINEINLSHEIEPVPATVLENAMKVFSRASSLTEGDDKDAIPLSYDDWEKMILHGIHD